MQPQAEGGRKQGLGWWEAARTFIQLPPRQRSRPSPPRIGLALGGGFARGIAHVGVLRVFEKTNIPIHSIAGVSAGAMVAAIYAAGCGPDEIEAIARSMRFRDVARWTINRMGFAGSERMISFLKRALRQNRFEDMKLPLAVIATDLGTGKPVVFRGKGDVVLPVRASCSYPGLFLPIKHEGRCLVDGGVCMEVPSSRCARWGRIALSLCICRVPILVPIRPACSLL